MNNDLINLKQKIEDKSARLAVIGLGYVGLPVACMFARAGFKTTGIDIDSERVTMIRNGENPIKGIEPGMDELVAQVIQSGNLSVSSEYASLKDVDALTISVQTPVDDSDHKPRFAHMRSALSALGKVMKKGALVIIESTVAPGTMQGVIIPALEEATGGKVGVDFWVGHCPERVTPGRLLHNITTMDRAVGGYTPEVADIMVTLYDNIVDGNLDPTDVLTAEIVKTTENAYRDVQIAFANEVAQICEALGADVWKVRELVNKVPGRNMLYPGAGVGGHCITKDSWLLIANVADQVQPQLIPTARDVNRFMPEHVANLTENNLKANDIALSEATIAVLGYAYMENSDDTRDTPSEAYIEVMQARGVTDLRVHDPFVHEYKGDLDAILQDADIAVILVKHDDYVAYDWQAGLDLMKHRAIVDARRVLADDFNASDAQVTVLGIGHPVR